MKKLIVTIIIFSCFAVAACLQLRSKPNTSDPRGISYAGSGACRQCHSTIYDEYLHTAHHVASLPASESTVHGSFDNASNQFFVNDSQKVVMQKNGESLFQMYYLNNEPRDSFRFDVVLGGVKGESYLFWNRNELYQLPLSYFSKQAQWSTSPGYNFQFLSYSRSRAIAKRCLECHMSYIGDLPEELQKFGKAEQFDKNSIVYGIDCERCHGPAANHVNFHLANPEVKRANYISLYSSLSRSQKIDVCAVCHSGKPSVKLRSTFEFMPGDTLAKYKVPEFYNTDTGQLDVHGNQVQLLQGSKCYVGSNMDCATCHNTHVNSRGNTVLYVKKCLNCHNSPNDISCKLVNKLSTVSLQSNCLTCHMPNKETKIISVQVSEKLPSVRFEVRTHRIAIYQEETNKVLSSLDD